MRLFIKAKKMAVGTVSRGRRKVAEGKWVRVIEGGNKEARLVSELRTAYGKLNTIDPMSPTYKKLTDMLDSADTKTLQTLVDAKIKFVSMLANNRLMRRNKSTSAGAAKVESILARKEK